MPEKKLNVVYIVKQYSNIIVVKSNFDSALNVFQSRTGSGLSLEQFEVQDV